MWSTPFAFHWPLWAALCATYIWVFFAAEWNVHARTARTATHRSVADGGTMRVMMVVMFVAQSLALVSAYLSIAQLDKHSGPLAFWVGLSLMMLASLLRRHCMGQLREHFTTEVRVVEGQTVVVTGAYRLLRHPSYTAAILMFLGLGLALTNWISIAILAVAAIVVYHHRLIVEESALAAGLGEPYRQFLRKRKRLIPYVY
jgi:protein-S-isoprenylcysteine O-methyltransferase